MTTHDITDDVNSLEVDEAREIVINDRSIALCKTAAAVFAVSNTCTHAEAKLSEGFVMDDWIECPLHQARYQLATGELLDGPQCPALQTYPISMVDGRVKVEIPEDDE